MERKTERRNQRRIRNHQRTAHEAVRGTKEGGSGEGCCQGEGKINQSKCL